MAADEPRCASQPFQAVHTRDFGWLSAAITKHYEGDDSDVKLLMAGVNEAFDGMSVDAYAAGAETALAAGFVNVCVKDDWAALFADDR